MSELVIYFFYEIETFIKSEIVVKLFKVSKKITISELEKCQVQLENVKDQVQMDMGFDGIMYQ